MSNEGKKAIVLDGEHVSIEDMVKISRFYYPAVLAEEAVDNINRSRAIVEEIVEKEIRTYGINTGFGRLSTVAISKEDIETLQRNRLCPTPPDSAPAFPRKWCAP